MNNYVHLQPGAVPAIVYGDITLKQLGIGAGLKGLPGDLTPPARFVRAFFSLQTAPTAVDERTGVLQAFHLLNNFDLPIGLEFPLGEKTSGMPSATQWTAVSNLSQPAFYYRTMYNSRIRKIDLTKIDFSKLSYQALPLDKEPEILEEVTF